MTTPRIVVLGGGYAGVLAALRAKARAGERADVTLVSEGDALIERIRLHELAVRERPVRHSLATLLGGTGVELAHARITRISPDERALHTAGDAIRYDALICAAGSVTATPPVPGLREHAHRLEPGAAPALRARLDDLARRSGAVVVVGGGLGGIEVAAEIAETHRELSVTLVTSGVIGEHLSGEARDAVVRGLEALGVRLLEGQSVRAISGAEVLTDRAALACDVCVWTGGFRASPLARDAGLATHEDGRCWVDPFLRALGRDDLFFAGDAGIPAVAPGSAILPGCKTAMPMGAHAAENAVRHVLGATPTPFDFRDTGYCISLGRRDGVIDARLAGRVLTGRPAAFVKEAICRYTVASLRWERRGLFRYRWLHTRTPPRALPAAARLPAAAAAPAAAARGAQERSDEHPAAPAPAACSP